MRRDLKAMEDIAMASDSAVASVSKFLLGDNKGDGNKTFNLTFVSKGKKYSFVVSSMLDTYAKFTVSKHFAGNSKFGDNPFYRTPGESITNTDNQLLIMFETENHDNFKLIMDKLTGATTAPTA